MNPVIQDGLQYYQFASLSDPALLHAVFSRLGGVSVVPCDSLNIGSNVGDNPLDVSRNLELMLAAFGLTPQQVVSPHQVHGSHIERTSRDAGGRIIPECDGLVTDEPGTYLLMRFADCVPVMLFDHPHRAIALVHAGWQGTLKQVTRAAVVKMQAEFNSAPGELLAAIGPAIGPCCLEVGPEVVAQVRNNLPDADTVLSRLQPDGHAQLDIWQANRNQLQRSGVKNIELAGCCTCCNQQLFYSHRGSHGRTGRFGALIGLR